MRRKIKEDEEEDKKLKKKYKSSSNNQVCVTNTPDTNSCFNAVTVVDVEATVKNENVSSTPDMN